MNGDAPRSIGVDGCLGLIAILALEVVAGFGVGALCYPVASSAMRAIVPAREADFAGVCAVILCFVPAFAVVYAIDKLGQRLFGHSVLDNLPFVP